MSPSTVLIPTIIVLLLSACTSAQRKAPENAARQKQAVQEVSRICSLPEPDRQAAIDKLKSESGMVLYCGKE